MSSMTKEEMRRQYGADADRSGGRGLLAERFPDGSGGGGGAPSGDMASHFGAPPAVAAPAPINASGLPATTSLSRRLSVGQVTRRGSAGGGSLSGAAAAAARVFGSFCTALNLRCCAT